MGTVLKKKALERIKKVHQLSRVYNGPSKKKHLKKLLSLVREHAREITLLHKKKDQHYLVETGDLLILCLEILLEAGASIDAMTLRCCKRYEKKLTFLLKGSS